ncbi:DUF934 domain-containing protein [Alkalimarinus alittae]|uniref:DUF934 domain-containing protein n=1 Tax=Alkalimarinus alittae TaxID=2961619 RepID=A0ABY6N6Y3_9ALTE|nr:DUF934 domain-containing protein [Alkalimarinus alittae]UZE97888.1 DUF934 domain-containing protein [Alkalimarinus alittae]
MPKLIKDNQIIDDNWIVVDADFEGALPEQPAIVPLSYWNQNKASLSARSDIGVWLDSHEEPSHIASDLDSIPVVAINFPKFADGRGYSYARLLRERFNYKGEIRAVGDVLQDQLFYMKRCGFNAFAVRADRDIEVALTGLNVFSNSYQAACDRNTPLFRRR